MRRDRLKIAVWYNLPSGGARRALFDQVQGLIQRGHHVETWRPYRDDDGSGFADLGHIVREHRLPLTGESPKSRDPVSRIRWRFRHAFERIAGMTAHSEACAQEIAAGDFDLLYAHNDSLFSAPFIGRSKLQIPKVLYLQEPQRLLYEATPRLIWAAPPEGRRSLKTRIFDWLDHRARRIQVREEADNARGFDRILVNSFFSRESLLRAYGREGIDAHVSYLGIDLDRFKNRRLRREGFVLGVGAVLPPKNLELPIRAMAEIPTERRPALVWVGNLAEKAYQQKISTLAASLKVDLRLRILIPDDELLDLLGRASAMVYTPHLEPFGYSPLEANACGLGVATVAEGGMRETVVNGVTGYVAAPEPEALAAAILNVMGDTSLGERAERHVQENWSLEKSLDGIERNLYEVLGTRMTSSYRDRSSLA